MDSSRVITAVIFLYQNRLLNLFLVAVAIAVGALLSAAMPFLGWLVSVPFHECGHALMYWLSGRAALPSFGATLALQSESSYTSALIFLGLLALVYNAGMKNNSFFLRATSVLLAVALGVITLCCSSRAHEQLSIYGGLGGELFLSWYALLLFQETLPRWKRWNEIRFPLLAVAGASFGNSLGLWLGVYRGSRVLPMGSLFDALTPFSNQSDGDLDLLIRDYQWTHAGIITVYTSTALVCVILLLIYFAVTAWLMLHAIESEVAASAQNTAQGLR